MKKTVFAICLFLPVFLFSQNTDNSKKIQILQKIYDSNEIKRIKGQKIFTTQLYETNASVPINDCILVDLGDSLFALAFDIYLSEEPNEYIYMIQEGIKKIEDITEYTKFQGGGERLMQVMFYDMKNETSTGPNNFPVRNLTWLPGKEEDDDTEIFKTDCFKKVEASNNTCILDIIQCPDCLGRLHYVFKYKNGKLFSSKPTDGCYEDIIEENNKLYINMISNCFEYKYDSRPPRIIKEFLFEWE